MHDDSPNTQLLIVDDEPANLRLLKRQFETVGYTVVSAENGADALHAARTSLPDLILLDIMLPDMDGYEVCAALKADPALVTIPVIFVSALYEARGKARAFEIGGVDYITKPFHFTELVARVELQIKIKRHQAEIQRLYRQLERYTGALEDQVATRTLELQQTKERMEAILENTSDILILTDPQGMIQQVNRAFCTTFDTDPDDVIEQPLTSQFHSDYAEPLQTALNEVVNRRVTSRMEVMIYQEHNNQTPRVFDLILSPVAPVATVVSGVVCSLRDISQQKQLETHLRQMLAHERELREMQSHFMEIVSHEFRTPLTMIQSASIILTHYIEQLSTEKRAEKLAQIELGVNQIVLLLEHVMTLDRAQTGRYELRLGPVELNLFCEALIRDLRTGNDAAAPIVVAYDTAPSSIITDETLLHLILRNLLSNAIKFSPPDKDIVFEITQQNTEVTFVVRDQGIGIPEKDHAAIFDIFQRGSNAGTIRGTGLGLAIVKQSVDLLKGTISFDSQEHTGTTFCVTIPST